MTGPTLITAATSLPVTLQELKDHLDVTDTAADALLARQLARARRQIEAVTGLGLASETWEVVFDAAEVTGNRLLLYRAPVASITSVTAQYADGTSGALAAANYYATKTGIALSQSGAWPTSLRTYDALAVRFVAGAVPDEGSGLRQAVLKLAAWYWALRGDQAAQDGGAIPPDVWDALGEDRPIGVA